MENTWRGLNREISNCRRCGAIAETRSNVVKGIGSPGAKTMIVGLAPGKDGADLTGIPFTRDPSGELINEMLSIAGLSRTQDVFITNLVKCNPRDSRGRNRTPSKEEIKNCLPYLEAEMNYLKPRVVVTLGKAPTEILLDMKISKMAQFHGRRIFKKGVLFFPFVHPSYVVRGAYDKRKYLDEFKALGDAFRELIRQESRMSRLDILLMLLKNNPEGIIKGRTRLQKLLFLVQNELKNRGYRARYAFRPYLYGPYSQELYTDIEWLRMNGLIEVRAAYSEKMGLETDFIITDAGRNKIGDLLSSPICKSINEIIDGVINKYCRMSVTELVQLLHNRYSDYDLSQIEVKRKRMNKRLDEYIYVEI